MTHLWLVWAMLFSGYLAARTRVFPEGAPDSLNAFVIYVSLPAVILRLVPRLSFRSELAVLVLVPWVLLVLSVPLVLAMSRVFRFRPGVVAALLLSAPLGNTSFLGFPLVSALLGEGALGFAALYDQLGSFLTLATYGLLVVARYSAAEGSTMRAILRKLATFPPFLALVVSLVPLPHPVAFDEVLEHIGATLTPVAMFAVGLRAKLRPPPERAALALGLTVKMLVAPIVAWTLCRALGASGNVLKVAVLEAGMPPMISAAALSMLYGFAPELSAALVSYGMVLSMMTVPALSTLLR